MTTAAIVLAGGRSQRMGSPKALLEWHGSTLVRRAVGIVARVVDGPVVVVRASGQTLPALPATVEVTEDAREARGPLQGIAAGLAVIGERAGIVFVTGVDAPFLHPALVGFVIAALGPEHDAALPHVHGFAHPLAAAYRAATVAPLIAALLAEDRLGTRPLFERCRTNRIDAATLLADPAIAALDPDLDSLLNLNEPGEYAAARARAAPDITLAGSGTTAAATLAGLGGGHVTINGRPAGDPQDPLVAGDVVRRVDA